MKEEKLKKFALWGVASAAAVLFSWAAVKYVLPALLPFLIAYALSLPVRPGAAWLSEKTKIPEKIWAVLLIVSMSALITFLLWRGVDLLVTEAEEMIASAGEMLSDEESVLSRTIGKLTDILRKLSPAAGGNLSDTVTGIVTGALSKLSGAAASAAGSIIASAPSAVFAVAVSFISLFYFALDADGIAADAKKYFSEKVLSALTKASGKAKRAAKRFLKAYLTIMLITFAELLVGFLIIGVRYAFIAALVISLVDILPVLGTGTVMIPWALILFITGESGRAVSILALFSVMYALRQFIEPKIVGSGAGVHPIFALVSVFAGFRLAGVGGMLLGPLFLYAVCVFWEEKS